jgi:NADH-quinone oxidoreductase subunit C
MTRLETLVDRLQQALGDRPTSIVVALGEVTVVVKADDYLQTARTLRDNPGLAFEQLIDLAGVDYSSYGEGSWDSLRYAVVLHLLSITHNWRLRVRTFCPDEDLPLVASLVDVWSSANWYEREAFDLYGIVLKATRICGAS